MVPDPSHARLSIVRQCRVVSIARSSFYYAGQGERPVEPAPDAVDRRPVLGDAVLRLASNDALASPSGGHGLSQTGAPPDATAGGAPRSASSPGCLAAPGAPDHPYLPRWDQPESCVEHGCYLHSPQWGGVSGRGDGLGEPQGAVLALSNTLDASFCVEALHEALERYGPPEIFNSDQGSQFTSESTSPTCSRRRAFASRWTARAAGWTTCSSSGCGDRSECVYLLSSRPAPRPGLASAGAILRQRSAPRSLNDRTSDDRLTSGRGA